jgi:hypothetical protein
MCPLDFILSAAQRAILICADPKKLKSAQDVTTVLEESAEWGAEWSMKIFEVIRQFETDYACILEKSKARRKRLGK